MKKNNFIKIAALSILLLSVSCNEDNDNKLENSTPKTELVQKNSALSKLPKAEQEKITKDFFNNLNNSNAGRVRGFCHEFTIHVNIGIFEVETSAVICCTTATMNCVPIPKHILHKNAEDPTIKAFEVTDSSIYTNEDGQKLKIKEGFYDASSDTIQFELEEVK
jgi:hypothetical protein